MESQFFYLKKQQKPRRVAGADIDYFIGSTENVGGASVVYRSKTSLGSFASFVTFAHAIDVFTVVCFSMIDHEATA